MRPYNEQPKDRETHQPTSRAWRRKYDCKKLKGTHSFVLVETKEYHFMNMTVEVWKCTACNKLDRKHKYDSN